MLSLSKWCYFEMQEKTTIPKKEDEVVKRKEKEEGEEEVKSGKFCTKVKTENKPLDGQLESHWWPW